MPKLSSRNVRFGLRDLDLVQGWDKHILFRNKSICEVWGFYHGTSVGAGSLKLLNIEQFSHFKIHSNQN